LPKSIELWSDFFVYITITTNMEQAPDTLNGIVMLMSVIPASIAFLTAFVTLFYKIDYKLEQELEATMAQNAAERSTQNPA